MWGNPSRHGGIGRPGEVSAIDTTHISRIGAVGVIVLAVLAALWFGTPAPQTQRPDAADTTRPDLAAAPDPETTGIQPDPAAGVTVHVSGAVDTAGLVALPPGARVADALAAAGGALAVADLTRLNLAAAVSDGEQVVVPLRGATVEAVDGAAPEQSTGDGKVAVNTADPAELESLPGVGPVLAGRIIDHRERDGPFTTVEDLLDVSGIGEATLENLRGVVQIP